MRIVFDNGEIIDCENVSRIYLDDKDEVYIRSNLGPILKEEYGRGYKDGYKTGRVDERVKGGTYEPDKVDL